MIEEESNKIPLLKKNGKGSYQPVFTDVFEFRKFCNLNPKAKFKAVSAEANKMPMMLAKEAVGAAINPFGINLQVDVKRKETSEA